MTKSLSVSPPNLLPWLSKDEKLKSIMLLDLEVDALNRNTTRFDLNVVFNYIPVKRGRIQKADCYIGTCGGEVLVEFLGGAIGRHTEAMSIKVNYKNTRGRTRKSAFTLEPTITINGKKGALKAGVGSLSWKTGVKRKFTTSFENEERIPTPINMGNLLRWVIALPRGEKAIRDFLIGNLYLYVECSWDSKKRSGRLQVRPSEIRFFDRERRPFGTVGSLLMLFDLYKQGIRLRNKEGLETFFSM